LNNLKRELQIKNKEINDINIQLNKSKIDNEELKIKLKQLKSSHKPTLDFKQQYDKLNPVIHLIVQNEIKNFGRDKSGLRFDPHLKMLCL